MTFTYSTEELKKVTRSITKYLYDMTNNRERLSKTSCMDLIEFLNYIVYNSTVFNGTYKT